MRSGEAARLVGDDQLIPGRQAEVLVFSAQLVAATPGAAMRFAKGYLRGVSPARARPPLPDFWPTISAWPIHTSSLL
jgi:hypothetical protein